MRREFEIDLREFEAGAKDMLRDLERNVRHARAKACLAVAKRAKELTPTADPRAISKLPEKPWWPKYIAKRLRHGRPGKGPFYTHAQAKAESKRIIDRRLSHVGALRNGWNGSIEKFQLQASRNYYSIFGGDDVHFENTAARDARGKAIARAVLEQAFLEIAVEILIASIVL